MIEAIKAIAQQAGEIVLHYYQKNYEIAYKENDLYNPVTKADKEADSFIR